MARKRKRFKRKVVSKPVNTKRKRTKKKTSHELQVDQLKVNSIWRVDTDDTVTTARGKEVSSGWQRCKITERLDATSEYPSGSVKVKYFDDDESEEEFEYDVNNFVQVASLAPEHVVDLTEEQGSSVLGREQPVYEPEERGQLLPVQRKDVRDETKWKNKQRKFDKTWSNGFVNNEHVVPTCDAVDCKLDCKSIDSNGIDYARKQYQRAVEHNIGHRFDWITNLCIVALYQWESSRITKFGITM